MKLKDAAATFMSATGDVDESTFKTTDQAWQHWFVNDFDSRIRFLGSMFSVCSNHNQFYVNARDPKLLKP